MQPSEMNNSDNSRSKASEAVVSELVRQTGDLGNYVLKAIFFTIAGLSAAVSVLAAFVLRSSGSMNSSPAVVPGWLWLVFAFFIFIVWLNMLHLTFVHVRASVAISNLTEENPRKYFTGSALLFSKGLLKLCKKMLQAIKRSHGAADPEGSSPSPNQAIEIPTASVAILEGFLLFSAIMAIPFIISIIAALRTIFL